MNAAIEILLTALIAGTPVSVTTLDGETRTGELAALTEESLDLKTSEGEEKLETSNLMAVEFPEAAEPPGEEKAAILVTLADRSRVRATRFETDGTRAEISALTLGAVDFPFRQVKDVLFAEMDEKVASSWQDLQERNARDDLLVFRKGDVLDYVAGSISKVTEEGVTVLVRDRELSAPIERIFGIVFTARADTERTRPASLQTTGGDTLNVRSLKLDGESLRITAGTVELTIPLESVRSIDFGGGRMRFLADLPFDETDSASPHEEFPVVWFVSRNAPAGSGGKAPLTIGTEEFRRGLWLHSGASLRFRLNREFQKLRGTAGFDLTHATRMPRFDPRVRLVILGDGRELYTREFHWSDAPETLDIELTGVREMVLRVESLGSGFGILEHFALGDAQVIQ